VKKFVDIHQTSKNERSNEGEVEETQLKLTDEQKKRRELFLYTQHYERKSDASLIYANIGLACLAIRRFLKAIIFSLKVTLGLIYTSGRY
jgi:hypothetical protein